jgi:acetoacetyl-CoA reductase/3-oxoacyl-[acyl-carrier protein] reductase
MAPTVEIDMGGEPMQKSSTKRVALVTGSNRGIGLAVAGLLARRGRTIILGCREEENGMEAQRRLTDQGLDAHFTLLDVGSPTSIVAAIGRIDDSFGRLDVLVNNAGINRDNAFLEMSDEEWETVTDTILKGTFMCSQEFARRYQGASGTIINFGATTGITGRKNGANYCPARAGVLTLTKCLALELAPNIRVNTVTPGRIDTEEVRLRYHTDEPETRQAFERDVPMKRMGEPEEIASMILYLVESGQYITGQNMIVDGGLLMR